MPNAKRQTLEPQLYMPGPEQVPSAYVVYVYVYVCTSTALREMHSARASPGVDTRVLCSRRTHVHRAGCVICMICRMYSIYSPAIARRRNTRTRTRVHASNSHISYFAIDFGQRAPDRTPRRHWPHGLKLKVSYVPQLHRLCARQAWTHAACPMLQSCVPPPANAECRASIGTDVVRGEETRRSGTPRASRYI